MMVSMWLSFLVASGLVLWYVPVASAQASDSLVSVVASTLRWYRQWKVIPTTEPASFDCRGEHDRQQRYFVYCQPGSVEMNLIGDLSDGLLSVIYVGSYGHSYSEGLADFHAGASPDAEFTGFRFVVPGPKALESQKDPALSRRFMEVARGAFAYGRTKRVLLFPWVVPGDPFYHVYVVKGGQVDSVWEFTVQGGTVAEFPHWIYDRPHKSIPLVAPLLAADESRWFRKVTVAGAAQNSQR